MDALTLLRLHIEWGADEALEDAPVDRLRPRPLDGNAANRPPLAPRARAGAQTGSPLPPAGRAGPAPGPPGNVPPGNVPPGNVLASPALQAAAAAGQAQSLADLRAAIAAFEGCALRDTAASLVFAAGDPNASLLLIGDPPGEAEDRSGTPFAGPDGALLDRMLASIGLSRDSLLLTPLIPWRPPGGRPPNAGEIAVCLPFLHRLIMLSAPSRLVIAGALAARTLLGAPRRRSAPAWIELTVPGASIPIPALALPGPAMIARTPAARRDAWAALRLLRRTLDTELAKS